MKWTKIMVHRKTNFLFTYPILVGVAQNFREGLFVWDAEGYTDFIMLTAEIWDESRKLSQRIKDEPEYVDDYREYSLNVCDGAVATSREISQSDVKSADNQTLQELASRLFEMIEKVGTTIIQTRFDAYEQVKAYAGDAHLSPRDLRTLIAPPDLSLLAKSQMLLLKLVREHEEGDMSDEEFDGLLEEHAKTYRWVTTDVGFGLPLTKEDLISQVEKIRAKGNIESEYDQLRRYSSDVAETKAELLSRFNPPTHVRRLMTALGDESFFRQYRRDTYSQAEYYSRKLFEEVGRRAGLGLNEVYYLTPAQIEALLLEHQFPDKGLIESRMYQGVLFELHNGQTEIVSGNEAKVIVSRELGNEESTDFSNVKSVEGEIAFPGRLQGTAKVIRSEEDLASVQHGDIFVGTQATPNLINRIIDKVSAVVTDEGDITSHAALVSWEHQLPCVVGTQNATKIFKSGDLVEVDAERTITERAVVRKL